MTVGLWVGLARALPLIKLHLNLLQKPFEEIIVDYDLDNQVSVPLSVTVLVCGSGLSSSLLILDAWVTNVAALHYVSGQWREIGS